MIKSKSLITLLGLGPLLLIPAIVISISVVVILSEQSAFDQTNQQLERERIESRESSVRAKVDSIVDLASYRKSIIETELHDRIKLRVEHAYKIADSLYRQFASTYTEEELQKLIIEALRPLLWNNGESFIWILDDEGVFYLAPEYLKHLEGRSILDFKDANGLEVIKEEISIVRNQGEGFLWDCFTKPGESMDKHFKQLAFVKGFEHYGWYLGSAEYLDTATRKTDRELLESISKVDKDGSDYVFIVNTQGDILLNSSRPELEGKNFSAFNNPLLEELSDKIYAAIEDDSKGLIEYRWVNPLSAKIDVKRTYVSLVPGTDWVVGSGFYKQEVKAEVASMQKNLSAQHQQRVENLLVVGAVSTIVAVLVSLYLSVTIRKILKRYQVEIKVKNAELSDLNASLEAKVTKRTAELRVANRQLEQLALTDSLTGVQNRYACMNELEDEVRRNERYFEAFSVIMLDVDFFKEVNDRYGHDVGDRVLVALAGLIQSCLRDVDKLGRFGGEEFIVVLPRTGIVEAKVIAERIRSKAENFDFKPVNQVTLSLGVIEYRAGESVSEVLKRVDMALYSSKDQGRNRITVDS